MWQEFLRVADVVRPFTIHSMRVKRGMIMRGMWQLAEHMPEGKIVEAVMELEG